ncbi:uncharacterized protein L201_005078 [Kwoniella dendrophila CBS 6074]|uniref:Mitotic checkpoint regulator, MAD2B-interacting-domain-containing protein n=1 Tax=Kwoniella dendrophila CBS 6074 TaxID=1295534 RepID=A0AAX4JXP6_9TREE
MLLANYASDSDSDAGSDTEQTIKPVNIVSPKKILTSSSAASTSKTVPVKTKKPVKITLGLPKSEVDATEKSSGDEDGKDEEDQIKGGTSLKIAGGKGGSSLLGMLPPPKRKLPSSSTTSATVNKGASLKVNKSMANDPSSSSSSSSEPKINIPKPLLASTKAKLASSTMLSAEDDENDEDENEEKDKLLPPSLARKNQKRKGEGEEFLDLFGLGTSTSSSSIKASIASSSSTSTSSSLKPTLISSAPLAPDYQPPEPSVNDPYPGYYQIPSSGEWKQYDPEYYNSFFVKQQQQQQQQSKEEEDDDGRIGKHWNEFNNGEFKGNLLDINPLQSIQDARKQEEINNLAKRQKVSENQFEYKPVGQVKGLASQRHQLTSLLNTAYTQREELEDRIAQNKKNMRMAGTKYGMLLYSLSFG